MHLTKGNLTLGKVGETGLCINKSLGNYPGAVVNYLSHDLSLNVNRDTYVERKEGESANDRNDRAIRRAVEWYHDHVTRAGGPKVVLLTNDVDNKRQAISRKLQAFTGELC